MEVETVGQSVAESVVLLVGEWVDDLVVLSVSWLVVLWAGNLVTMTVDHLGHWTVEYLVDPMDLKWVVQRVV